MTRTMDQIGAGDVAVGQKWRHATTEVAKRQTYTVVSVTGSRVHLTREIVNNGRIVTVNETASIGSLLSDWVLLAEAGVPA